MSSWHSSARRCVLTIMVHVISMLAIVVLLLRRGRSNPQEPADAEKETVS
ncbi:MAG: hypothetical protein L0H93_19990 [Nocardioides sp.]|nr:hypothetical protein [Nocardioides sp.]